MMGAPAMMGAMMGAPAMMGAMMGAPAMMCAMMGAPAMMGAAGPGQNHPVLFCAVFFSFFIVFTMSFLNEEGENRSIIDGVRSKKEELPLVRNMAQSIAVV